MRAISFEHNGKPSFGLLNERGIINAGARLANQFVDLRSILMAGALEQLRDLSGADVDFAESDINYLPVIPNASKIICVGINYLGHIKETGREIPTHPVLFTRFSDSIVGHNTPLIRPKVSTDFDYEGELAVIIGKRARHVSQAEAMDYVAGYSCFNEGSIRDFQMHTIQFTAGKNFYKSGSFGPCMVTTDEQSDPGIFHLQTRLNGQILQDAPVSDLCFNIPQLIEYCSSWTPLEPGDVIVTGTPGGVGRVRKPPIWMKPGDTVEIDIQGVGLLSNTIVDEKVDD
jgi:2-keto-4-pentenoate hydratase/2-oxohepta-3-ene-1,7-dioic acid hydratase in catechol pathway